MLDFFSFKPRVDFFTSPFPLLKPMRISLNRMLNALAPIEEKLSFKL